MAKKYVSEFVRKQKEFKLRASLSALHSPFHGQSYSTSDGTHYARTEYGPIIKTGKTQPYPFRNAWRGRNFIQSLKRQLGR